MAIIGGGDRPAGPIVGAAFILFSERAAVGPGAPRPYMILLGALLIGFVLLAPSSLSGPVGPAAFGVAQASRGRREAGVSLL